MDNINNESTGDLGFEKWANKLETMSDGEISYEIYQRILTNGNLDNESRELFSIAYDYCIKLIHQGKNLEPNLLKIYLQDIKGKDISQINIINIFALLGICGINFTKLN